MQTLSFAVVCLASYTRQKDGSSKGWAHLFHLGVPDGEAAHGVAGVDVCALQRDDDVAVLLAVLRRPVLIAFPLNTDTVGSAGKGPVLLLCVCV